MNAIVVAGIVNVSVAHRVPRFPVALVSSQRQRDGISIELSGVGWAIARTMQELGDEVKFATYVGADALGSLAVQGLSRNGLYGNGVQVCRSQPRSLVVYDQEGTRSGTSDLRDTNELSYPCEVFERLVDPDCSLAVLTNVGFTSGLIPYAVDRGIPIATDLHNIDRIDSPHDFPWMHAATILACSHERLPCTPQRWVRELWRHYDTEIVLIGCGSTGAVLATRSPRRIWRIEPVVPRGVHYVSGAGDTLFASFLHHYLPGADSLYAARNAVLNAGWQVGGNPADTIPLSASQLAALRSRIGLPLAIRLE